FQRFSSEIESSYHHRPPSSLQKILHTGVLVFSILWIFMLALVIYFQLERIAIREAHRWSLMKMLGAAPRQVFMNHFSTQMLRIVIGSLVSVFLCFVSIQALREAFHWSWEPLPKLWYGGFMSLALCAGFVMFFTFFSNRYRKTQLG